MLQNLFAYVIFIMVFSVAAFAKNKYSHMKCKRLQRPLRFKEWTEVNIQISRRQTGMEVMKAKVITQMIRETIANWHAENADRAPNHVIVTDAIRRIRPLNEHREDLGVVIRELVETNTEMWHEEDKVRSDTDAVVLRAIRNINPLNQHRNDLIEEIDEIVLDNVGKR